jgi:rhodanese-related sulfurtransferase
MKRVLVVLGLVLLLFTAVACSAEPESSGKSPVAPVAQAVSQVSPVKPGTREAKIFRTIPAREAQTLMATRQDLLVVDLREESELREGFIAGSQLLPMSALSKGTKNMPENRPLLLICAIGGRSNVVGRYFSAKGFPEIYNLQGGISAWKQAGLPLQY